MPSVPLKGSVPFLLHLHGRECGAPPRLPWGWRTWSPICWECCWQAALSPLWGLSPTERNCLVKVVPPSRDVLIPGLMAEWVSRFHSRPSSARASWGTAKASVGSASQSSFSLCPNPASSSFQMLSPGTALISLLCCNVVHLRVCCLGKQICSLFCQGGPQPLECKLCLCPHLQEQCFSIWAKG